MIIYHDDLCVEETSKKQKTKRVLKELNKVWLSINLDKCEFYCDVMSFLGFKISKEFFFFRYEIYKRKESKFLNPWAKE